MASVNNNKIAPLLHHPFNLINSELFNVVAWFKPLLFKNLVFNIWVCVCVCASMQIGVPERCKAMAHNAVHIRIAPTICRTQITISRTAQHSIYIYAPHSTHKRIKKNCLILYQSFFGKECFLWGQSEFYNTELYQISISV